MSTNNSLVDTVVIVMMENRSFDHLLGFLSHELFDARPDVDGLHQYSATFDWDNADDAGNLYSPTGTPDGYLPFDLPHSRTQIDHELNGGAMDGFIKTYFASQQVDRAPVPMRFCLPDDVPVSVVLAREYSVCDRWFASVPADTQPNRLMALSGATLIDTTDNIKPPFHLLPDQPTIFDWLETKKRNYEIFVDAQPIKDVGAPSNLLLMRSQWGHVIRHGHALDALASRWQSGPAPDVIYCEPFYNDFATVLGVHGNCNHPPLPVSYGEDFLNRVYTTLTSVPEKWKRTVMVICYDEHGGFFDHVAPPGMEYNPPPRNTWSNQGPLKTLGVRIPGIIVSPLVDTKTCFHGLLDHTSILQFMVELFGAPSDLAFFGDAPGRRARGVLSLSRVLTRTSARADIPKVPPAPTASGTATTPPISNLGIMFRGVMADKPALHVP